MVKDIFQLIIKRVDDEIGRRGGTFNYCLIMNIRVEYLGENMTGYIQLGI